MAVAGPPKESILPVQVEQTLRFLIFELVWVCLWFICMYVHIICQYFLSKISCIYQNGVCIANGHTGAFDWTLFLLLPLLKNWVQVHSFPWLLVQIAGLLCPLSRFTPLIPIPTQLNWLKQAWEERTCRHHTKGSLNTHTLTFSRLEGWKDSSVHCVCVSNRSTVFLFFFLSEWLHHAWFLGKTFSHSHWQSREDLD